MKLHPVPGLVLCAAVWACDAGLPAVGSSEYMEAVRAFHTGLAAVQAGEASVGRAAFRRVTELAPGEPAGWADLGLTALLQNDVDTAVAHLSEARALAPANARIRTLSALAAEAVGDRAAARRELERAVELAPEDVRSLVLLARVVEESEQAGGAADAGALIDRVLAVDSTNLAAFVERARLAAAEGQGGVVADALDALLRHADLPAEARARVGVVRELADSAAYADAAVEIAFLQADLQPLESYRRDRARLYLTPARTELLMPEFVRLPRPDPRPAALDTTLRFEPDTLRVGDGPARWVRALWLDEVSPLVMAAARADGLWLGASADSVRVLPVRVGAVPTALEAVDYDYNFLMDLAAAGPDGLRLFRNRGDGFTEVTETALPELTGSYVGVWSADLDMEGDLDLVAARAEGPPVVLRNRGDGRFERMQELADIEGLRAFAWADLDGDGDPDAAALDAAGRLHVYLNRRAVSPRLVRHPLPGPVTDAGARALAVADLDRDAVFELVVLDGSGALTRIGLDGMPPTPVGQWPGPAPDAASGVRLFVEDLDNNGQLDVLGASAAGSHIWLGGDRGLVMHRSLDVYVTDLADIDLDGRLDLVAIGPGGTTWWLANRGDAGYASATLRPRAVNVAGDRRINSFGIGGEIEVRAGLLYQKLPIRSPTVHFGLGEWPRADVARIVWPNGTVQAEFNVSGQAGPVARQRLKGSCPWVFAYDGQEMRFVTDFLWRTALGLRINAQQGPAVIHSEDWVRIPGRLLAPRDGVYDVRITAELWETHFFDHVALMAVDHPSGTEVLVDERFALPAPTQRLYTTGPVGTVAAARDQRGRDVTAAVRAVDGEYLDTFRRGPYQGVAREHFVEVALPPSAPSEGLLLVASGWVYPTDSSINLAIAQGDHAAPRGIRVEAPDGAGGWTVVHANIGFPAGKSKTILVDLDGAFPDPGDRRVRLRTNMEIYWDRVAWAVAERDARLETHHLLPATAELRYRGFSEVRTPSRSTPERPFYQRIATTAPIWRDLVGYHTRFGDVRPLTRAVDDRYVIMNAGDELRLRFPALPDPPEGWTRDFVLIGDGWVKDGDYNTGFSTTVRPLPYHGMTDYSTPPGRLEDDPAYRMHPDDWARYHTRYVTPEPFRDALLPPPGMTPPEAGPGPSRGTPWTP